MINNDDISLKYTTKKSLSSVERQEAIHAFIERKRRISVNEICRMFDISQATARRDLEALSDNGKVQRVHGGAIYVRKAPPEKPILERSLIQAEEKKRIGVLAAELVKDGDAVFLGSGTTVLEVAKNLHHKSNLTVITNSLLVIDELGGEREIAIIALGGILRESERSLIGYITERAIEELRVDKVFMGIRAISLEQGLTNDYLTETMTDRAIMGMGNELIIVADHTKCDRVSTAFVASLDKVNTLVTNKEAPEEFIRSLIDKGIRVLLA
jgi:DeoR/GlpR family transcriptional regulator of sugar metabolism